MAAFVYLNGYPGVGKLTIAKELAYVRAGECILVLKLMCHVPESSFRGQKCLTIIFSLTQSPPFLIEA